MRRFWLLIAVVVVGIVLGWALASVLVWIAPASGAPAVEQDETEPLTNVMASGIRCGRARWQQKTLTDPAAQSVNLSPLDSTIEELDALPAPAGLTMDSLRFPSFPSEFRAFKIHATLVAFKLEPDQDVHLVLRGTTGATMIAEIPDPRCAHGSVVLSQIAQVRKAFIQKYGAPDRLHWRNVGKSVVVTGIIFFDEPHSQRGVAPNAVELHPVIALQ